MKKQEEMVMDEQKDIICCDWCGCAGAEHEGGMETEEGTETGNFCCKEHFDKWVLWISTLSKFKSSTGNEGVGRS